MKKETLSFVIPCYNSEYTIKRVVNELTMEIAKRNEYFYEIILINDGSIDDTYKVLIELQHNDRNIVIIDLMRNFGQAAAQMAGFNVARGDYIFNLDDDGQMPIDSIFDLLDKLKEGYDVVFGKYDKIKQKWYRNLGSMINAKMMEYLVGKPRDLYMSSFCVAVSSVIEEIIKYKGPYPYIGGLLLRVI